LYKREVSESIPVYYLKFGLQPPSSKVKPAAKVGVKSKSKWETVSDNGLLDFPKSLYRRNEGVVDTKKGRLIGMGQGLPAP